VLKIPPIANTRHVSQQLVKKVKKPKGDGRLTGKIKMNEGLKMGPKGVKQ